MQKSDLSTLRLPDKPGVYEFVGAKGEILYVGKATSLRDRVRSYFANDLLNARGKHIVDMVATAKTVRHIVTDSVLEALILEASMIKKYMPRYNTVAKDDKSWNYVVITKEDFPCVYTIRERALVLHQREQSGEFDAAYGPFTEGKSLQEALKIIRRIFPFRDKLCKPGQGKRCFNAQIGLCPGVCSGEITKKEYAARIREIKMLFSGKKSTLLKRLKRLMVTFARHEEFERAAQYRNMINALRHIRDVALIKEEVREISRERVQGRRRAFRIEAYDIAHLSGDHTVGVMVVVEDGHPKTSEYRRFKIRTHPQKPDDILHLAEILRRRFAHTEWQMPDLIVVDGGVAQKRCAERVLAELGRGVDVVAVVKDERHKPRELLGARELIDSFRRGILIGNAEAHRCALAYHKKLRDKMRP